MTGTIFTSVANCQDCYRCVRSCPVKAIRIRAGQARIDDARCIQCGTCVRECPKKAKRIRSDLEQAKALAREGEAAVSVAPSFAAAYSGPLIKRLPSALRSLGFRYVCETAEGAEYITKKSFEAGQSGRFCTACPAVVNYVEKYKPGLLDSLIPVVSPMVAHGRLLKARYGGCPVVFIGPCAAKKSEALRPENEDAVDAVLTFAELEQWFADAGVSLSHCPESGFDGPGGVGSARLFPVEGGMLVTGYMTSEPAGSEAFRVSGAEAVMSLFRNKRAVEAMTYIEPLFCFGGCVGGPAFPADKQMFERRRDVVEYWDGMDKTDGADKPRISHTAEFSAREVDTETVTEDQINKVLESTGKTDPEFQLNCGACGYDTCVKCAAAIIRGMAEPEMCIPYMRRLAQQRTDKVIETDPNGVVVLDGNLNMIHMNPAFQKMFSCGNNILGRKISYLVNAGGFELLQSGARDEYQSVQKKFGIRYHEILYALREDNQYVGIYADISKLQFDVGQLDAIKIQTLRHAQEFLDHQIKFSQEMAHYLGQSAAQSEEIARRLIGLYERDNI